MKTYTSLAESCPELAAQWHTSLNGALTPAQVTAGSGRKVWWQCLNHENHTWESSIKNQYKKPRCPYCAGTKTLQGFNDLASLFPDVASQFHATRNPDLTASMLSIKSAKKVWWICQEGHEWEATVFNRTSGRGCPVCSGYKVNSGSTDLLTLNPELASQWHPTLNEDLTPSQVTASSHQKVWWLCAQRHTWEATVGSRSKGNGCPYCGNRKVLSGFNDLATKYPALAQEWHPTLNELSPTDVLPGSDWDIWWSCTLVSEHQWKAPTSRRVQGSGCPMCAGKSILAGDNDLMSALPDLARQWHPTLNLPLTSNEVTVGSRRIVWWQCEENHEWQAEIRNRKKGTGCPYCTNYSVLAGYNDLATVNPYLTYEWDYTQNTISPEEVTAGSGVKVHWRCLQDKTHQWIAPVAERSKGNGCPICRSKYVTSKAETEILHLLVELGFEVLMNGRSHLPGTRQELDLYIPAKKFAIEFNGVYWHSETFKSATYHNLKQQACAAEGITLYQVWEDDWKARPEIVLRGIAHRLGVTDKLPLVLPDMPAYYTEKIGARQTQVKSLGYQEANAFLNTHHIQGGATGTHYLGLTDSQERLRAVLVLKRTGKTGELSIERYATAGVVSGGFNRLLKHAEKTYEPTRWVTFADLSLSDGGLYEKTGFTAEKILKPDYSYLVGGKRVHKFNYRLKRFREDPNLLFEEGLTERELAALNGLVRIWDSGKVRYVKTV